MDIDLIFKIAAIGIIVTILHQGSVHRSGFQILQACCVSSRQQMHTAPSCSEQRMAIFLSGNLIHCNMGWSHGAQHHINTAFLIATCENICMFSPKKAGITGKQLSPLIDNCNTTCPTFSCSSDHIAQKCGFTAAPRPKDQNRSIQRNSGCQSGEISGYPDAKARDLPNACHLPLLVYALSAKADPMASRCCYVATGCCGS